VADLDQQLRDCLRRHADDAHPTPQLASEAKARSRQLTRRAHATVALALVPATAGLTIGSAALADGGSGHHDAKVRAIGRGLTSATSRPAAGPITFAHCPRGEWVDLDRLGRDTQIAVKPIGIPTFIRRYTRQHPNEVEGLSTTRKVVVDGRHRLSPWSYAIEIVTTQRRHVWQLMIGTPPHADHYYHRSSVYNAARHGCIAVREPTG
jgi:hypothetical protein